MSAANKLFKLSILIPTIPDRKDQFDALNNEVKKQVRECDEVHPTLGLVEVLFMSTPTYKNGGPSIGEKRHKLVQAANGEYLCFLDDDEGIAPNYIETLLRLMHNQTPSVCTFRSIAKMDNFWCIIDMSLKHKKNEQASPNHIIKRPPWHICPVRFNIAQAEEFNNSNYGEDWDWFERVLSKCTTESKSNAIIHQYNHSNKNSQADNITTSVG